MLPRVELRRSACEAAEGDILAALFASEVAPIGGNGSGGNGSGPPRCSGKGFTAPNAGGGGGGGGASVIGLGIAPSLSLSMNALRAPLVWGGPSFPEFTYEKGGQKTKSSPVPNRASVHARTQEQHTPGSHSRRGTLPSKRANQKPCSIRFRRPVVASCPTSSSFKCCRPLLPFPRVRKHSPPWRWPIRRLKK